jgi:hypothetical protein
MFTTEFKTLKARKAAYAICARHQRWEQEYQARKAEEKAAQKREHEARWAGVTIRLAPSPLLAGLRGEVFKLRETRCPKWRFRLAPDLVIQIQPRPGFNPLFECIAIEAERIELEHFKTERARRGMVRCEFGIVRDGGAWLTKPHLFSNGAAAMMTRVAELLPRFDALSHVELFSHHCLICGKALIDAASMARMIGPECAGTHSLDAGLIRLKEPAVAEQGTLLCPSSSTCLRTRCRPPSLSRCLVRQF